MRHHRIIPLDRRVFLSLVGIVIVGVLALGGWLFYAQLNRGGQTALHSSSGPALPKPSGKLSQFSNAAFGYTLQYPAEWGLNVLDDETYMNVYVRLAQGGPGLPGFVITCAANPSRLTAQQWWQAHVLADNHETSLGLVTLASRTQAYKSTGQGEQPYELYTMVHSDKVCQIVNQQHGTAQVTQQAETAINSFRWN